MSDVWQIVALAPVAGSPRPRAFAAAGGKAGVFMPKGRWDRFRSVLRTSAGNTIPARWDATKAMSVDITIMIVPPKRFLSTEHTQHCTRKPDIDNTVKLILDSLTNIVWVDDTQVTRLSASRVWGNNCQTDDRTVVVIRYA